MIHARNNRNTDSTSLYKNSRLARSSMEIIISIFTINKNFTRDKNYSAGCGANRVLGTALTAST